MNHEPYKDHFRKKELMSDSAAIIQKAIEVLKIEADGITNLIDRIDDNFSKMVELICNSGGRIIISGIGKSGIIGRKIVATLNSTGTRSLFLHPVEAMHGDLGQVTPDDIFIALSKSGETDELNILLPLITHSSPSRWARHVNSLGSAPAWGSVIE